MNRTDQTDSPSTNRTDQTDLHFMHRSDQILILFTNRTDQTDHPSTHRTDQTYPLSMHRIDQTDPHFMNRTDPPSMHLTDRTGAHFISRIGQIRQIMQIRHILLPRIGQIRQIVISSTGRIIIHIILILFSRTGHIRPSFRASDRSCQVLISLILVFLEADVFLICMICELCIIFEGVGSVCMAAHMLAGSGIYLCGKRFLSS